MITELLAGLAAGMAYGGVGTEFARRNLPAAWAWARRPYGTNWADYWYTGRVRRRVTLRALAVIAFWPAVLSWRRIAHGGRVLARYWGQFIDAGDPEQHKPPLTDLRRTVQLTQVPELGGQNPYGGHPSGTVPPKWISRELEPGGLDPGEIW